MPIQLTSKEEEILREILERYLPNLRIEVANTDDREYRKHLKEKEAFMKEMLARLGRK